MMECVVHYSESNRTFTKLKALSENQHQKLLKAKAVREKETSELNQHLSQCQTIPGSDNLDVNIHGVHLEPCYKKFTSILAPSRKRKLPQESSEKSDRLKRHKSSHSNTGLFPKKCFKCNTFRKRKDGKFLTAYTITTENAASNLKEAAILKNDHERIVQFNARDTSNGTYLIEKELMMHRDCYKNYIRCLQDKDTDKTSGANMEYGDFLSVKSFIDENILNTSNAISMRKIHALYGTGYENENARSYRAKLKQKIINQYGNSLLFLTIDAKTPQVIISAKCLDSATIVKDKKAILIECAKVLREDIINYAKNYEMPWPLTIESIKNTEQDCPKSVNDFLTSLLKSEVHDLSDSLKRTVSSFASDLISAVTRGKVVTLKHFLLGVGLHNITGLKTPIKILSHLGHCIDYNLVCEAKTSQAELAMQRSNQTELTDDDLSDKHLTYWWADNFNQNVETQTGHGAIDSTHIVEFSEGGLNLSTKVRLNHADWPFSSPSDWPDLNLA